MEAEHAREMVQTDVEVLVSCGPYAALHVKQCSEYLMPKRDVTPAEKTDEIVMQVKQVTSVQEVVRVWVDARQAQQAPTMHRGQMQAARMEA